MLAHEHICRACGRDLAFDPEAGTMWSGEWNQQERFLAHTPDGQEPLSFKVCAHRDSVVACNWLVAPSSQSSDQCQCIACRTTQLIPDQSLEHNRVRWHRLEQAKRHLFYSLVDMGLVKVRHAVLLQDLRFDFLEDRRSNPNVTLEHVLSGHCNGLITLNAAEADEGFLHTMKEQMGERYRTLLGHFRHEIGHYFWTKLFAQPKRLQAFRQVFGDEREDYARSLERYYNDGRQNHWRSRFITPYACSHPHEDWAETWAHYMHIIDTLQTAQSFAVSVYDPQQHDFEHWFAEWARVAQTMNALNRSMGVAEPYPFKLSEIVVGKLRFIDEVVKEFVQELDAGHLDS